jgi:plasmid stability protein
MEAEARAILEAALTGPEGQDSDLASFARSLFAPLGGVELELPPRDPARDPPSLEPMPTAKAPARRRQR